MNLIITTRCNKGCSFCFAREKNKVSLDMTMEDYKRVLTFIQNSRPIPLFKLLGGEPTIHPLFSQMLKEAEARKLPFTLISNGLYKAPSVRKAISESIQKGMMNSILFNAAELENETLKIFAENYMAALEVSKRSMFSVTCGITLHRAYSVENELKYVAWLIENLEIHHLRISLDFPGDGVPSDFFINNTVYGCKIMDIIELCNRHNIVVSGDCIIYPCLFKDRFFVRKKLGHFVEQTRFICYHDAMPFDVYPDLSYFHCYPAQNFGGKNLLDFDSYQQAITEMRVRKQALLSIQKKPETCLKCDYFKVNECEGLCLGCSLPRSVLNRSL